MFVTEAAHWLGVVPLVGVALVRVRRPVDASWWWMAAAFAVSFVADSLAHVVDPGLVSQVYPVTQAGLFALVLLPRRSAEVVIGVTLLAAASSLMLRGGAGLDVLLHVIAWGSVVVLALRLPQGPLRVALVYGFTAMIVGWLCYVWQPGWASWALLQTARAWTAVAFCVAVRRAR